MVGRAPAVVVGVDGSERNHAAVDWAVTEAATGGRDLLLVGVAAAPAVPPRPWAQDPAVQYSLVETRRLLDRVRRRLRSRWDRVEVLTLLGTPSLELVDALVPGDLLVVGRRGLGPVERAILGSTSIEAAGRSPVATVIVPDDWDVVTEARATEDRATENRATQDRATQDRATDPTGHAGRPIVVGVDGTERDGPVLDLGFSAAVLRHVTLVVVAAWEAPPLGAWDTVETERWTKEAETRLAERLLPWTRQFPGVDVACYAPAEEPAVALLEDAHDAQLVVLGRYPGVHHLLGFSGFSTCRRVLHHADCPVAIVPMPAPRSAYAG